MNKKIFMGYAGAVLVILLMISSATAVNLSQNDSVFEKTDDKQDSIEAEQPEMDNTPKSEKPAGMFFSLLIVEAVIRTPVGSTPGSFRYLELEDLDTGRIRRGFTGFLGFWIFFGLRSGHNYELRVPSWGVTETIENLIFFDWVTISIEG